MEVIESSQNESCIGSKITKYVLSCFDLQKEENIIKVSDIYGYELNLLNEFVKINKNEEEVHPTHPQNNTKHPSEKVKDLLGLDFKTIINENTDDQNNNTVDDEIYNNNNNSKALHSDLVEKPTQNE
eukprot:c22021_g1_i6.p1 GENE.c22021_g1_i6~~c22021_g1_i6.p1  ORF type:complete len:127 (+),score=46.37 c22021_g1_i6:94-474(+)